MIDAVAVSPLRQRMIEDMTIRRFGEHTQRDYVRQVREFTAFLGLPPDRAEPEDLRRYQLHLASLGASYARMNLACTALRFFFHVTLGRTGFGDRMARIPTPDRLPVVLDKESDAAAAYVDAIKRLLGEEHPHRFLTAAKRGFFSRLFAPSNAYAG